MLIIPSLRRLLSILAIACVAAHAQRTSVTAITVAAALSTAGLPTKATQVEVPTNLSALRPDPQLHLSSAELLPDGRLRVRMTCGAGADCLPFLATVRPLSPAQALTGLGRLQKHMGDAPPVLTPAPRIRVLAGRSVTMLLEDPHMRITLPMVAIDTGAPGVEIRVSSPDHRQTYRGVVVDAETVRGVLP